MLIMFISTKFFMLLLTEQSLNMIVKNMQSGNVQNTISRTTQVDVLY